MLPSTWRPLAVIWTFCCLFASSSAQWQLTSLVSHDPSSSSGTQSNTSLAFTLQHGSSQTACSENWAAAVPTAWVKCQDPMVRFRIAQFNDVSNFTFEIVDIVQAQTTVNITRTTAAITTNTPGLSCSSTSGTQCTLSSPLPLTTTASSFTPSPLEITYQLSRNDGSNSGVIPCTEGWTFYITNPNVATLGPITLGRGTEKQWQTACSTGWNCGGTDPSVGNWVGCQAPAFQFQKTLPSPDGDQISNFNMSITHTFPLLMASSIRGSNLPDYQLTDPEEAAGLQVKLVLADTQWKNGVTMSPIVGGGIDQTGDCGLGCEFSGGVTWVGVVGVVVI